MARKHNMELDIQQPRNDLQVVKHMGDKEVATLKQKVKQNGWTTEIESRRNGSSGRPDSSFRCQRLEECKTKNELQDACKELIMCLNEMSSSNYASIGIKRMSGKPFQVACK